MINSDAAPQDEVGDIFTPSEDEVCQTLVVRSAATPRVSNHEAAGYAAVIIRFNRKMLQIPPSFRCRTSGRRQTETHL